MWEGRSGLERPGGEIQVCKATIWGCAEREGAENGHSGEISVEVGLPPARSCPKACLLGGSMCKAQVGSARWYRWYVTQQAADTQRLFKRVEDFAMSQIPIWPRTGCMSLDRERSLSALYEMGAVPTLLSDFGD